MRRTDRALHQLAWAVRRYVVEQMRAPHNRHAADVDHACRDLVAALRNVPDEVWATDPGRPPWPPDPAPRRRGGA